MIEDPLRPDPREAKSDRRFIIALGVAGLLVSLLSVELTVRFLLPLIDRGWSTSPVPVNVGFVSDWKGIVTLVRGANRREVSAIASDHRLELEDLDRLETNLGAEVTVTLPSQEQILVKQFSIVSFEAWNADDPHTPVYVRIFMGDVESTRPGVRGGAFVIRDGRLYYPSQRPGARVAPLVVTRAGADDLGLPTPERVGPSGAPAPTPSISREDLDAPLAPQISDARTLSNEYVREMVNSRQAQFQKCWLSRLKDRPTLKGKLTIQFEITRRGRVRDLKVADSDLNDETLHQCVTTVVERIPFRTFMGPEISIAYPIAFE